MVICENPHFDRTELITAMISCRIYVSICGLSIRIAYYTLCTDLHHTGVKMHPHNDQLPVDLIAQLVEHCTGVTEVKFRILLSQMWLAFEGNVMRVTHQSEF